MELLNFILKYVNQDILWNNILDKACLSGNLQLVKFIDNKGCNNYNYLFNACLSGNIDIVNYLINKGATDFDDGLNGACARGNINLINLMINYGATDFDSAMLTACNHDNFDVVKLMLDKGAKCVTFVLNIYSLRYNSLEKIKYITKYINKSQYDLTQCILNAYNVGNYELLDYYFSISKYDLPDMLTYAKLRKDNNLIKLILYHMQN